MGANEAGALPGSREARAKKGGGGTGGKREGGEGNAEGGKRWRIDQLLHCHQEFISAWKGVEGRGRRRKVGR